MSRTRSLAARQLEGDYDFEALGAAIDALAQRPTEANRERVLAELRALGERLANRAARERIGAEFRARRKRLVEDRVAVLEDEIAEHEDRMREILRHHGLDENRLDYYRQHGFLGVRSGERADTRRSARRVVAIGSRTPPVPDIGARRARAPGRLTTTAQENHHQP